MHYKRYIQTCNQKYIAYVDIKYKINITLKKNMGIMGTNLFKIRFINAMSIKR